MPETFAEARGFYEQALVLLDQGHLPFSLALVAVATVVALLIFGLLRMLSRRTQGLFLEWAGTRLPAIRFQNQEIFSVGDTVGFAVGVVRWIGYGIFATLLYLYLQAIFLVFPVTRGVARLLLGSTYEALAGMGASAVEYIPNVLTIVVLIWVGRQFVRLTRLFFDGIGSERIHIAGFYAEWADPTFKIVRAMIVILFVIVIFPYLPGSESPAFRGVSIFLGVLLSLGSSGAVANAVSGVVLTYMRAFELGDRVKIADAIGDVVERTLFVTRVRTPK